MNNERGFPWKKTVIGIGIIALIIWLFRKFMHSHKESR